MKILIYQPRASYFVGGGEIYPLQNAKFFVKLGHDVTLLTTRASFLVESEYFKKFVNENPKVKIEYLDLDNNYKDIYDVTPGIDWERWDKESLWVSRLAYQYMDKYKFDVITIHNVIDALSVPFKCKHFLHLHGAPNELNYICKLVLEKQRNIIAVSEKVKEKWKNLGVNQKISVCTNAIDQNVFIKDEKAKRTIDFLFVGRLIPTKGVQYILEAIKILKDEYKITPNFTIIGDGPYKEELINLMKKLKIEKQVKFCGLVSQEILIKSYQTAKVAVLPSFEKEGIMSTLLEAASCGTPSITTKGTSMEEFAMNNKNALLVEPRNSKDLSEKMYKMLSDEEFAKNIAKNAFKIVEKKYTWLNKAQEIIDIYNEAN